MEYLIRGSEYLTRFGPDWKLVGRDRELHRLVSILMRGRASSVIVFGPGGVGCTAVCAGIQALKETPDAPFDLVGKRLFWLDTNALFSSGDSTKISHAFDKILGRFSRTVEPILMIDDTRDFIEACRNNGATHLVNAALSMVRDKRLQVVLETKEDDLDGIVKAHSDIRELFTMLPIEEPDDEDLKTIVAAATKWLVRHHGIRVVPEAMEAAIDLTTKYRLQDSRAQPERSITLLDRSLSTYRLKAHGQLPPEQRAQIAKAHDLRRQGEVAIAELDEQIDRAKQNGGPTPVPFERVANLESEEIGAIRKKISAYQAVVYRARANAMQLTTEANDHLALTKDLVLDEFSDISGIPADKLDQDEREKLKGLEGGLGSRIFGQAAVLRRVADAVKVGRVGGRHGDLPQAAFLFLGPSGVGKTELAKALSWYLFDDPRTLTRFDMSEYMEKHAVAKLIGAPPGYEGFDVGGILTNLMRKNGHRVLLFDEIEKGHPDVFNIFLQVLSDGRLTDNVGRTVSFRDSIIVMTTNIGQDHFLNDGDDDEAERAAMAELGQTYRSEFLNRFAGRQNIICFKKLGLDSIRRIVDREVESLDATYKDKGLRVVLNGDTVGAFCEDMYDPRVGARGLPGFISAHLEPVIVEKILGGDTGTLTFQYDRNTKLFESRFACP